MTSQTCSSSMSPASRRFRCFVLLAVCVVLLFGLFCPLYAATLVERPGNVLELASVGCVSRWSATDGSLLGICVPGQESLVRTSGPAWTITFVGDTRLTATEFLSPPHGGRFSYEWDGNEELIFSYSSEPAQYQLRVRAADRYIGLSGGVARTAKAVKQFEAPCRLLFRPEDMDHMVFPQRGNSSLGLSFRRSFFREHGEERAAKYRHVSVGPVAYETLMGGKLNQIEDSPDPCALTVTEKGKQWLSSRAVNTIAKRPMVINRAPSPGQMEIVLVDSPNGPALCATQFGGKGYFLRFTGKTSTADAEKEQRVQTMMIIDALEGLVRRDPGFLKGRQMAVISLRNGPPAGGWSSTPVKDWVQAAEASRFLTGDSGIAVLTTPGQVKKAMRNPQYAVILNPYGEWLPTGTSATWREDIAALRDFVVNGGAWVEVGGFPFYYVLEPLVWESFRAEYPPAVADFTHLVGVQGGLVIDGPQRLMDRPWQGRDEPERLVVPTYIETGGAEEGGWYRHGWYQVVEPGMSWQSPMLRLIPSTADTKQYLTDYAAAIGLDRPLAAKMKPDVLDKLRESVLIRLHEGTFERQVKAMEDLPHESLVHFTEYLHGGFDKQYPDHLPPRESWGTSEQLSEFYRRGKELGHLMMPYTNTSWWCIGPMGETFLREGEAPLARKRDGNLHKERYAKNEGYTVCYWHPAVQAAHRRTRKQMSEQYPSDVLFQDQVGARRVRWDYNNASPTPTASVDGLHSLSIEDSAFVPLATEDGYDRVAQFESMLCGMAWATVPVAGKRHSGHNKYRFAPGDWEFFPTLGYLAHDKAIFTLHDLGHFVTDPERLSYCMAFGYALSYACSGELMKNPRSARWLYWLDALQKTLCCRYAGTPLLDFDYPLRGTDHPAADEVMMARFPDVTVVANVSSTPLAFRDIPGLPVSPDEFGPWLEQTTIAGPGFVAWTDTALAGWVRHTEADGGIGILAKTGFWKMSYTILAPAGVNVCVPGKSWVRTRVTEAPEAIGDQTARVRPKCVSGQKGVLSLGIPAPGIKGRKVEIVEDGLFKKPVSQAVINVIVIPGAPSSWVQVSPENWLEALAQDPGIQEARLRVEPLTTGRALLDALTKPVCDRPFAIVNPGGEVFSGPTDVSAQQMLSAIRSYVADGGIWWETGGYSFYQYATSTPTPNGDGEWRRENVGASGAAALSFGCMGYDVEDPALPLKVTPIGRTWFGEARSSLIRARLSGVQRAFTPSAKAFSLVDAGGDPFVAAIRCDGIGWLWRLGGFSPDPEASTESVAGVLAYLATHPWPVTDTSGELRLWEAR